MEKIEHKMVAVNGINMHIAELGQGPTILFIHGFPELWYSWRHQMVYLAERGYRAVAPDLRGYGDTTGAPVNDISKFSICHLVGDLVALLEAIAPNEDKVFVAAHDWGALIAWYLCLFRPDKVKALVNLSVHFSPRNPHMNPVEGLKTLYGEDHYFWRFQVPGEIEAEFAPFGAKAVLKKFLTYRDPAPFCFPKGKGLDAIPEAPAALSSWLSEEELDYYAGKFEKTGFTGAVNYYRAFPLYSWRHQIVHLAERGYRAVAPDLRGYGDTTGAPLNDPSKFSILHLVGDLVALLEAIAPNEDKVFVVGHDWGASIAWHLCFFRPDKVKALVNLSVHFFPRSPQMNPVEGIKLFFGEDHYVWRFQVPGEIEAEFAPFGAKVVLKKLLTYRDTAPFCFPKGKGLDAIPDAPIALSSWLSEEELDYFASKFEKTGFTGAVNYYRAFPLNWELTAPWTGAQVKVPTKFIVGEFDMVYHIPGAKEYIHNGGFKKDVPLLEEVVVLEGAAHFVNQERPDEISNHIYNFIQKF